MCYVSTPYHTLCAHYGPTTFHGPAGRCAIALSHPCYARAGCEHKHHLGVESSPTLCAKCLRQVAAEQFAQQPDGGGESCKSSSPSLQSDASSSSLNSSPYVPLTIESDGWRGGERGEERRNMNRMLMTLQRVTKPMREDKENGGKGRDEFGRWR